MWWTNPRKTAVSGGLAALSVILALTARTPACTLAAAAMCVSTAGDTLLAGYPPCLEKVRNRLTKGGLIFLTAHILYVCALVLATWKNLPALLPFFVLPFAILFGLTILQSVLFYVRHLTSVPRSFFAAAFAYLLTAGVHAAAAIAAAEQSSGRFALNAVGALLFYLSDAILLAGKYGAAGERNLTNPIWFTYAPAQLCIVMGFFLAQRVSL